MKNPFNPGSGALPPYLAGRETHISRFEKILESIEDGHSENAIVHGLRGTGKTVLLDEFNKICIRRGFLPVRRSQFSDKYCVTAEFEKAFEYDLRIAIETFSKLSWLKNKLKAGISYLKPSKVGVPDLFYYEPSYGQDKNVPFEDYLRDYLQKNWPIFENAGKKGVIFLYDEFHTVTDKKQNGQYVLSDLIAAINEAQKQGTKYFLVLCGLPNLQLNVKKSRSYSERMFTSIEVSNLSSAETALAIEKALDGTDYSFERQLADSLFGDTEGYPYFIQFYGKEIISNIEKKNVGCPDYERIKPVLLKQLDVSFFDPRFELASHEEEEILCRMSRFNGNKIPFEFIKRNRERAQVAKALSRLEAKGMVYNYKRGIYRFSLPMFRDYLKRKCS